MPLPAPPHDLDAAVTRALDEDVGSGDVTAALVPVGAPSTAYLITREEAIICGRPWFDAIFARLDASIRIQWHLQEGDRAAADQRLCTLTGPARPLLTGERPAINFLQTLSATATAVRRYVDAVAGTGTAISDTRKTLPGLRTAQKYAVVCGGGINHRIGLYDGILIKENHIAAAGGIRNAIARARDLKAGVPLMTEAENLDEARAALEADVDLLLVDEFSMEDLREAVALTRGHRSRGGKTVIEYSGGTHLDNVRRYAECGVDRIAIGAITKHVHAVDLSMRFASQAT